MKASSELRSGAKSLWGDQTQVKFRFKQLNIWGTAENQLF